MPKVACMDCCHHNCGHLWVSLQAHCLVPIGLLTTINGDPLNPTAIGVGRYRLTGISQNVIPLSLDTKPMPSVTLPLGVANSVEAICLLCRLVRNCAHSATNIT